MVRVEDGRALRPRYGVLSVAVGADGVLADVAAVVGAGLAGPLLPEGGDFVGRDKVVHGLHGLTRRVVN